MEDDQIPFPRDKILFNLAQDRPKVINLCEF